MTTLLDITIPRALDRIVERFTHENATRIEAWLFEDAAAREAARQRLAAVGIEAHFRSAYKPLLHFMLEETALEGLADIVVKTPLGDARRYRLEAYPLGALLGPSTRLAFEPGDEPAHYVVTMRGATHRVFVPATGDPARPSASGWLRVWQGDTLVEDAPLVTEFEAAFAAAMRCLAAHRWPRETPYFERLTVAIGTGGIERRLPYFDECISTREALHEELYFSILEFFQHRADMPPGDRTLQPGQIVPVIRERDGDTTVRVSLSHYASVNEEPEADIELAATPRPPTLARVARALRALNGTPFSCRSREGREVAGTHIEGTLPGLVVTAGQHANETSGIVGALRAAHALMARADANFAVIGVENPDGYALHRRLRQDNPRHMLHAARYTALGDDLEARMSPPFGEKAARLDAIARTGAGLHISMHGYPAHEWTRPLSGYIPRGFEHWTLPKGFFLILRHHAGLDGLPFLERLTARLAESAELAAFNAAQLRTWDQHAGALPFATLNGIPCMVTEDHRSNVPFTLVTEYPDQTLYDDAFRLAHTTQMRAVLIAADLYWSGALRF
jgi:hypothetical protein